MHLFEKRIRSEEFTIVNRTRILESSRSQIYRQYSQEGSGEEPERAIYEILLGLIRKQTRKPFQLFKQFLLFSSEESSIEVSYKHARYELEIVEENIRSACTLIRQRMLVDGFISIKNLFLKKLRVEEAYYNEENLLILETSVKTFQSFFLKWEGFGKLYEHFRGSRLLKLNLSKIDAISNDYTSRELEDFHPFLMDRVREADAIHSDLGDGRSDEDSRSHIVTQRNRMRTMRNQIKEIDEEYIEEINNRSLKKSQTAYIHLKNVEEDDEIESRLLLTHRKEAEREEAGSTARPSLRHDKESDSQQIYLIRDYRAKGGEPTNYIKVPMISENVKIVEIHTKRKKVHKKRVVRQSTSIQEQICANCKYCVQMREERAMMRAVQQRYECVVVHCESNSTSFLSK